MTKENICINSFILMMSLMFWYAMTEYCLTPLTIKLTLVTYVVMAIPTMIIKRFVK